MDDEKSKWHSVPVARELGNILPVTLVRNRFGRERIIAFAVFFGLERGHQLRWQVRKLVQRPERGEPLRPKTGSPLTSDGPGKNF